LVDVFEQWALSNAVTWQVTVCPICPFVIQCLESAPDNRNPRYHDSCYFCAQDHRFCPFFWILVRKVQVLNFQEEWEKVGGLEMEREGKAKERRLR